MNAIQRLLRPVITRALGGPWIEEQIAARKASIVGGAARAGINVTPATALGLTAYYAAVNCISTDIACLPLKVYRRRKGGGRDEARDDHRWERLNVSPNGETTAMRWRQAWLSHALGWGDGMAEIETSLGGEVLKLHLLDPAGTRAERNPAKELFYRLPNGKTLPPHKVIHLAGLGFDGLRGYTPALLHKEAVGLALAAEAFGATFFGNGTNAEGVLEHPGKLGKEAIENLRESIEKIHGGPYKSHKLMILEEGMKFSKTTIDPEAAQFLATREHQVLEVARMFRCPPNKLGDYSQAHLANLEFSNIDYLQTTLGPWCTGIEQELNRKLFTTQERAEGFYVKHDMKAFLRGDSRSRAEYYTKLRDLGALSPNEIRDLEELNPIEGGDTYLVPMNMARLADAGKAKDNPGAALYGKPSK